MRIKAEVPNERVMVNFKTLPKGVLVRFQGIIAVTTWSGVLVGIATGDTWSGTDFEVEVLPKGTKITLTHE